MRIDVQVQLEKPLQRCGGCGKRVWFGVRATGVFGLWHLRCLRKAQP